MASARSNETAEWAIRLLITQLYDPDVEVCETAVRILEEACNTTHSLEYVVKCRPALDHLGEIGAPLLLRFLSTSVGYHYLNELDYIHREMDDWFHVSWSDHQLTPNVLTAIEGTKRLVCSHRGGLAGAGFCRRRAP